MDDGLTSPPAGNATLKAGALVRAILGWVESPPLPLSELSGRLTTGLETTTSGLRSSAVMGPLLGRGIGEF